jgi:uncharacterized phage infection (PIP) family protein YhgE
MSFRFTDGSRQALQALNLNTDQVEGLLQILGNQTDGLEPTLTSIDSRLAAIDGLIQTLDGVLDNFYALVNSSGAANAGFIDDSTLLTSIVDRLTTIRDNSTAATRRGTVTAHNTSAANAAASATIAAPGAGLYTQLKNIYFGYSDTPTNGVLSIAATGLTTIQIPVTAGGAGFLEMPLRLPVNTACTLLLSAGGAGITGYVSAIHQPVGA